ncbi:kelch-like protein 12 [Biomphalaria glabrata]|uniref:Kelch-like protein 12 n=2 Tax=Biomphalaria glabrata TaxID=6526 RepID=A0A9W3A7E3_BIOGL|nr:kelch-like protein 12 [Biomphalaria glabrata]XP_055883227.1 kelch-like protein 12 [Biomphalaria glabrata]XP_055883228.1 kelch-like protein 12 [Biomphalaria glabrata]XP_055883229.1 kelch-like protein 12 [Biomphalaria glabrata]XP_055883230.1 kelch-like protein 12 [Biomphalaria glabrata]XP_055883231.1 kelch-like protein 12 [Biomphalaria glabrata]
MEDCQMFTDVHSKEILSTMNTLRKANKLCDVVLRVEKQCFPAHRIVLAASSDYFNAMFTNGMKENNTLVIDLHEIPANVMEVLLDFVYTETVEVSVENVQELLPAACLLQLTGVKNACCRFLERQLDASNCLGIKVFAENHCCQSLLHAAERYALRHFNSVIDHEEFKIMNFEEVESLVSSEDLQVKSEETVYQGVITWVKSDEPTRLHCLPRLLAHVRLPLLSVNFITDILDSEILIRTSHACRDLVDEAKRYHLRPDLRDKMCGPKTTPRAGTDSILVVLGGFGSHQNLVDTVESFCSKTDTWTKLPNLTRKRRYVSAASVANKLYVVGGYDGQSRLSLVEKLDFTQEKLQWETVTAMHQRRGLAGICVYKDQLYVCGGFDGYSRHSSLERFNPVTEQWTMLSAMATGREGAGLVAANDLIYCIGGYDGTNLLSSAECYDPQLDQWSNILPMSTQRSGAGVAVLNNMIYVCGGYDGTDHLSSVECYNTKTNYWTTVSNMQVPRCYVGACVFQGKLMVTAGYDGKTLLDTCEVYDPAQGTWKNMAKSMTISRCDAGVTVIRPV